MYIPKHYGESRIENCPFCGKTSVTKNSQGVPVCINHKNSELLDLKCVCGEYLDIAEGKWGPYFRCMRCGNVNFKKALEMNPQIEEKAAREDAKKKEEQETAKVEIKKDMAEIKKKEPKRITTITSDELDLY